VELHFRIPGSDRRHYVDEADVEVVLSRMPAELTQRIHGIYFSDDSMGNRRLGYTTTAGRRDITLCALPPNVSLNGYIRGPQTAQMFGAVKGAQWPALAIRRYTLYNTLLHEIGHLQVVHERARHPRRKFADEPVAEDFANEWREDLWSKPFAHPDPAHNPPSADEIRALASWGEAHAEYKRGVGLKPHLARKHFERAAELFPNHAPALTGLAQCLVTDALRRDPGAEPEDDARARAVDLLGRALVIDPTSFDANLRMGWNCGHLGRYEDARRHIARALHHGRSTASGLSALGDAHADWGFLVEAERLFQKALSAAPEDAKILRDYARAVWDLGAHTPEETSRAIALFERALTARPDDPRTHFYFARALAAIPGELSRAIHHAERALALRPSDTDASKLLTRLRQPLRPGEAAHLKRYVLTTRTFDRRTGSVVEHA
jgi:tetratricopeptide (TPR) repeat protein